MKKLFAVILTLFLTACATNNINTVKPIVTIIGDVAENVEIKDYSDLEQFKIEISDETVTAVKLKDILNNIEIKGSDIEILVESYDGVSALLKYDEIEDTYLYIDEDRHWCVYGQDLPIQSRIKYLENIVVVTNELEHQQKCFRIINGFEDYEFSYGQLYLEDGVLSTVFEGDATLNDKTIGVYKKRKLIPLKNYYQSADTCIGYFADGLQIEIDPKGYLLHRGNSVDYINPDKKTPINDIIGVWFDYHEKGVEYVGNYVKNNPDEKVMVIEIDGYGYTAHEKFKPEFLSSLNIEPMRTVMPSISNVALASIITGELPNITGIKTRPDRELTIDDMFSTRDNAVIVEGNTILITMSKEQTLSLDTNNSGSNDDEVYDNSISALNSNPDLIYIHFHGFDDVAHIYGPYSQQANDKILELDGYIKSLVENFNGTVMVVSDHGQHEKEYEGKKGNHGEFIYEDMVIPFFTVGDINEK